MCYLTLVRKRAHVYASPFTHVGSHAAALTSHTVRTREQAACGLSFVSPARESNSVTHERDPGLRYTWLRFNPYCKNLQIYAIL